MKTLTIELSDELYDRVHDSAMERGVSPQQHVAELVERLSDRGNGDSLAIARARMQELFHRVRGFRTTQKIPREELYERGRVH